MAWAGSSKPRRRRFWQWTRRSICTTPAGPTRRWATAPLKRRTAWRHESVEGRTGKRVRTGRERPVGCAASRLRSGSLTRLRSAAKRRNQPQISHIRKTADKLTNLSQDLTLPEAGHEPAELLRSAPAAAAAAGGRGFGGAVGAPGAGRAVPGGGEKAASNAAGVAERGWDYPGPGPDVCRVAHTRFAGSASAPAMAANHALRPQPARVSQRNQRPGSRAGEPSLGGGFDLCEDGRGLSVPIVDYRPVFPQDCGASDWGDAGNPGDRQGTGPSAAGFAGGGPSDPPFGSRVPVLQS